MSEVARATPTLSPSRHRAEGRRRNVCIDAAAGNDGEFKMWRQSSRRAATSPGLRSSSTGGRPRTGSPRC